jgi:ribonuclease HI
MTSGQLCMTCINAVSNYESEIWWKNQEQFRDKLQKLQKVALKKILDAFRTSSVAVMKIEANIISVNIWLDQKNQKLRLRMLKMKKDHSIRLKISNFSLENWNETLNDQSTDFSEWNETRLHATQLIRIMHTMSEFITDNHLIEKKTSIKNIWRKTHLNLEINQASNARETHLKKIETIFQTSTCAILYTNAVNDSKSKISAASCVYYNNTRTAYKSWNFRIEMSIDDAELYAIEKAISWFKTLLNLDHIWIFTDNQNAIECIKKSTHFLADKIYETVESLTNIKIHIHWISEHANISENEKADKLANWLFCQATLLKTDFYHSNIWKIKSLNIIINDDHKTERTTQKTINTMRNSTRNQNTQKLSYYQKNSSNMSCSSSCNSNSNTIISSRIWSGYWTTIRKNAMKNAISFKIQSIYCWIVIISMLNDQNWSAAWNLK